MTSSHRPAVEAGFPVGQLPTGPRNAITDVPGVRVGHCTLDQGEIQTGVTVILPPPANPFLEKMTAAVHVVNGFGKSTGLMQLEELGTLETPIALTNTLSVGRVTDALIGYMLDLCRRDDFPLVSVNPVVCECNDGFLNRIEDRTVGEAELLAAIANAGPDFAQGAVGAGRGMVCHGLKGGIGSSSRVISLDGQRFTLGVLALTNHGRLRDLQLPGIPDAGQLLAEDPRPDPPDKGSCILILATDLPVDARQLKRILRRCPLGLARLGSFYGHGSGELALGFTTADPLPQKSSRQLLWRRCIHENRMDLPFRAAAEASEEAILNALLAAEPVTGRAGREKPTLSQLLPRLNAR